MTGAERIAAERQRQIDVEGYDAEHDAQQREQLALAAACYAGYERMPFRIATGPGWAKQVPAGWPWEPEAWKPTGDRVRDLEKAGALIAAAIDALTASSNTSAPEPKQQEMVE